MLGLGPQGKESLKGCLLLGQPQRACPYDVHRTCWVSGRVRGTVAQCPHRAHRANSLIPIIPQEHTVEHGGCGGRAAWPRSGSNQRPERQPMPRERRRSVGWCRCSVHIPARRASPSPHPRRPRRHRRSRTWLRGWRGVRRLLSGALTMFGENNDNRHDNRCLPPGELHSPGHCTHSMDHEHKEIDARARAEVAMGRDCCECSSFIFHALRYP